MKKVLYIILLITEAVIGFFAMSLSYTAFGWGICIATLGVMAALLAVLIRRYKRQKEAEEGRAIKKTLLLMALVMLIPTLVEVVIMAYIIAALSSIY